MISLYDVAVELQKFKDYEEAQRSRNFKEAKTFKIV